MVTVTGPVWMIIVERVQGVMTTTGPIGKLKKKKKKTLLGTEGSHPTNLAKEEKQTRKHLQRFQVINFPFISILPCKKNAQTASGETLH